MWFCTGEVQPTEVSEGYLRWDLHAEILQPPCAAFPGHAGSTHLGWSVSIAAHYKVERLGRRRWDAPADDSSSYICCLGKCPGNLLTGNWFTPFTESREMYGDEMRLRWLYSSLLIAKQMTSGKTFVPSCERLVTKVAEDLICWGKEGRRGVKTQISGSIEAGTLSQCCQGWTSITEADSQAWARFGVGMSVFCENIKKASQSEITYFINTKKFPHFAACIKMWINIIALLLISMLACLIRHLTSFSIRGITISC